MHPAWAITWLNICADSEQNADVFAYCDHLCHAEPVAIRLSNTLAEQLGNSLTSPDSVDIRDTIANGDALAVAICRRDAQCPAHVCVIHRCEQPR